MKKRTRRIVIALVVLVLMIGYVGCRNSRISDVESHLGVAVPAWTRVSGNLNLLGQDYENVVNLKFTQKGLNEFVHSIEQTRYFNLQHNFYGSDQVAWKNSDTTFYFSVRNGLKDLHLTGYWIKTDSSTYVFHEPDLSDIPNSSILFDEAYQIEAELNIQERMLMYRFIKY